MDKLRTVETEIIIAQEPYSTLRLNEQLIFPHGYDGLHIWEAGIILARWVQANSTLFQEKSVLELGSGVGIGGLAVAAFTEASRVLLSDYNSEVVKHV